MRLREGLWAKLDPRDAPLRWHPLVDHAHDVAACAEALLGLPLFAARLARLAGRPALPPIWIARLTVLAFLHDFGKANRAFQARSGGHIAEAVPLVLDPELAEAAGLAALDHWFSSIDAAMEALVAVLAHHGAPPDTSQDRRLAFAPRWEPGGGRDPLADVAGLVAAARSTWPAAFAAGGEMLPTAPRFWHGFLGLLQLADWLGSDSRPHAFPFTEEGDPPRRAASQRTALRLLSELDLDLALIRHDWHLSAFEDLMGFPARPVQSAAAEAAGPLVVLESETGSGKTEAALYRFARLFAAGKVDGLYFALPTRVAATQMFARVQRVVQRMFPAAAPLVVRALPGDAGADGAGVVRRLPGFEVQWDDDPGEATRRRRWAAETPKRFLAAPIAVGTIDQALLGAAKAKHAQMRSFCLSRSLLVVDEVHASDRYMAGLLRGLLSQHVAAGGEALLLSATLGAEARTSLMLGALGHRPAAIVVPGFEAAQRAPYPAVTTVENGKLRSRAQPGGGGSKEVRLEPAQVIDDPQAVAELALAAAKAGARVLVIRNLVRDAIATRQALERLAPGAAEQFVLAGVPTLHHGRFAREDRRLLDAEVERRFGRDAGRAGGLALVGTQTVEISLDIDADLMITDLCPVDVLLQRIGRLHRHQRQRPAGFEAARCVVLMPDGFEAALATQRSEHVRGSHGHGTIYEDLPALEATRRLIGQGSSWAIPGMNRHLVEAATHPEALRQLTDELAAIDPRWNDAMRRRTGNDSAMDGAARRSVVEWDKPVGDFHPDDQVATRLGGRDVELRFDPPLTGAFGAPVTRLVIAHSLNPAGAFEPAEIVPRPGGFGFRLGEERFIYDGYGLRREESP